MSRNAKRSPLDRAAPVRVAGQSLDQELENVIYDHVLSPLLLALFIVVMAGMEWYRYVVNMKPSPWIFSIAAIFGIVYAAFRIWRIRRRIKQIKLGRDGERAVAQYLEWFRKIGRASCRERV